MIWSCLRRLTPACPSGEADARPAVPAGCRPAGGDLERHVCGAEGSLELSPNSSRAPCAFSTRACVLDSPPTLPLAFAQSPWCAGEATEPRLPRGGARRGLRGRRARPHAAAVPRRAAVHRARAVSLRGRGARAVRARAGRRRRRGVPPTTAARAQRRLAGRGPRGRRARVLPARPRRGRWREALRRRAVRRRGRARHVVDRRASGRAVAAAAAAGRLHRRRRAAAGGGRAARRGARAPWARGDAAVALSGRARADGAPRGARAALAGRARGARVLRPVRARASRPVEAGAKRQCVSSGDARTPGDTDPVVIMLVRDVARRRCLLGRSTGLQRPGSYSCLEASSTSASASRTPRGASARARAFCARARALARASRRAALSGCPPRSPADRRRLRRPLVRSFRALRRARGAVRERLPRRMRRARARRQPALAESARGASCELMLLSSCSIATTTDVRVDPVELDDARWFLARARGRDRARGAPPPRGARAPARPPARRPAPPTRRG